MRQPMNMTLLLLCAAACKDNGDHTGVYDTAPIEIEDFCTSYSEADSAQLEDIEGSSTTNGRVIGRLIQGVVADPVDPRFVSFVDYLIDNLDVGGQPTVGRTDADGYFTETLGSGNWRIKTSGHQSSYYCAASYEFVVQSNKVSRLCVDMNCE
ncbi:MAG: hypothetical protein H6741_20970 [Alphaproteobacteria bacterium]|nr:hypothetical protein [Alphaproteobacteria bacterium]